MQERGSGMSIFSRCLIVLSVFASQIHADDWPEFQGAGRKAIWNETGIIEKFESPQLKPLWKAPVGAGYAGPTVAGDRVFVMDHGMDGVTERVLCFDRKDGSSIWKYEYPCQYDQVGYGTGPRASVTIAEGRAYSFGTMGNLHCFDAASGKVIWAKNLREDYDVDMPIWGLTNSPLVEGGKVIVQASAGREGACVVAFDAETGKESWRAFKDKASYVSPMMIEQAGKRVLIAWTGYRIAGMNAATGDVFWELPTKPNKMPINVPNPAINESGTRMLLTTFYDGSRMLELNQKALGGKEMWHRKGINERKTDALHCMISPPFMSGNLIFGVDSYGQLRCLDSETGDRIWENLTVTPAGRWSTVFMVRNGGRTWMLNEQGELIIAELTADGFNEVSRAKLIEPATSLSQRKSGFVVWSPPAFAHKHVFARSDKELICVDLSK